jgi:tetratricopeptide (TPR) repeat protein
MMTNLEADKFNIAWFKLAEFVARKEKERAFGIYRLLVHSLPHSALAAQLEGDLFLAFNDEKAVSCYIKAAELYHQDGKIIQAIAIYEHCITLFSNNLSDTPENKLLIQTCFHQAIKLYGLQENNYKLSKTISLFVSYLANHELYQDLLNFMQEHIFKLSTPELSVSSHSLIIEQAFLTFLQLKGFTQLLEKPLRNYAVHHSATGNHDALFLFMTKLSQINHEAYQYLQNPPDTFISLISLS